MTDLRVLFRRSEEKNGLRYTTFVGDGDRSSYTSVCKMNLYGSVPIKKENCIGHIQKRMGCRLRKLVQESKGQKLEDGKCLSGRGRLIQKVVDCFQVFYGIALRSNSGNIESTKTATMAILNHYASTPEDPNHDLCPVGGNSWCKYQVDQATGTSTYRYPKYPLPDAVLQKVLPVFKDLSAESLLITCQRGLTQNPNEALHSMLWKRVPKKQYFGEPAFRIASALVCGHWNSGQLKYNKSVCEAFGYDVCYYSESMLSKVDRKRTRDAEYKYKGERQQRRKDIRKEKLIMEGAFQKKEGTSYESGHFLQTKSVQKRCRKCEQPMKGHKRGR